MNAQFRFENFRATVDNLLLRMENKEDPMSECGTSAERVQLMEIRAFFDGLLLSKGMWS